jgi:hypothetical protein
MPVTFMLFGMMASRRSKPLTQILPSIVIVLAGLPILYLTSIDGFRAVFDPIGNEIPLLLSLGVMVFMYWVLIYVNKKIIRLQKSEIEIQLMGDFSEHVREDQR